MDTYALRLFLHLSNSLHFARTSQACHVSPSTLTRQIQRLEEDVGQHLFERDNRMVKLTTTGHLLKSCAIEILGKWQSFKDEASESSGRLRGEINLYCSVTASFSILPEILETFKAVYPEISIRLQTGDAESAIRKIIEDETDIAVAARPDNLPKNLLFKNMTETPLVFIGPRMSWEFSDLTDEEIPWEKIPMILSTHGLARKRVNSWFKKQKLKPNIYAQVSGNEAILSMVSLGCGIGIVPKLVIEKSPIRPKIDILGIEPKLAPYVVGICVQKRKLQSRLVRAFWDTWN